MADKKYAELMQIVGLNNNKEKSLQEKLEERVKKMY
jgi:hypothetical protein